MMNETMASNSNSKVGDDVNLESQNCKGWTILMSFPMNWKMVIHFMSFFATSLCIGASRPSKMNAWTLGFEGEYDFSKYLVLWNA
jgi:hypothetical protein